MAVDARAIGSGGSSGRALTPFRSVKPALQGVKNLTAMRQHAETAYAELGRETEHAQDAEMKARSEFEESKAQLKVRASERALAEELAAASEAAARLGKQSGNPSTLSKGSYVQVSDSSSPHAQQFAEVLADHRDSSSLLFVKLFPSGNTAWVTEFQVVCLAPALWHRHAKEMLEKCRESEDHLHQKVVSCQAAHATAQQALDDANQRHKSLIAPTLAALQQVGHALTTSTRCAAPASLVTLLRFRDSDASISAWRDVADHVICEWAVRVGSASNSNRMSLLSIAEGACLAKAVVDAKLSNVAQAHVLEAPVPKTWQQRGILSTARHLHALLEEKEAERIMRCARPKAEAPRRLQSSLILKAALGGIDGIVVDSPIQEFFNSQACGVIRAKDVEIPTTLGSVLRPYQQTGFRWLVSNALNGFGCILADDMGLGKTLQAITFMLHLKQQDFLHAPALVVVPKSLLGVWVREISQWAPELTVHVYYGNERCFSSESPAKSSAPTAQAADVVQKGKSTQEEPLRSGYTALSMVSQALGMKVSDLLRSVEKASTPQRRRLDTSNDNVHVFLTSYGTLRSDVELFVRNEQFSCMILDEAQIIKNYSCQTSRAVRRVAEVVGTIRVALSGTPVENRLAELHSLFEFILPGYLASSRGEFERDFARPIAAEVEKPSDQAASGTEKQRQKMLQRIIQPFVLRRLKTDPGVAPDLPKKIEVDHPCELSEKQKELYRALQETELQGVASMESNNSKVRRWRVLALLHAFREVCNHPASLKAPRRPAGVQEESCPRASVEASGKCVELKRLLQQITDSQEKAVVFCQYLDTIDILEEQITSYLGSCPLKYTGSLGSQERQHLVSKFQKDASCPVMLLSLQAGGVGLTLTAASHVIHFDRCYNPAKENQATDRVHRIGQERTVCVHRLIATGTFEEKLADTMARKQRLSDSIVQAGEGWVADLDDDELRELFALSVKPASRVQGGELETPQSKRRRVAV